MSDIVIDAPFALAILEGKKISACPAAYVNKHLGRIRCMIGSSLFIAAFIDDIHMALCDSHRMPAPATSGFANLHHVNSLKVNPDLSLLEERVKNTFGYEVSVIRSFEEESW